MTLGARIVAALSLAALVPMAVVLAVPLVRAGSRARQETARLVEDASRKGGILLDGESTSLREAADRAAKDLAGDRESVSAFVRGPERLAQPVARGLAERYRFDRVVVTGGSGLTLAESGDDDVPEGSAVLVESRQVLAPGEDLMLAASRVLGPTFLDRVGAIAGGTAAFVPAGTSASATTAVVPLGKDQALSITIVPADAGELRRDLLKSFAGVAPVALVAALLLGVVVASRIARPIRALAVRAEEISAERSRPITLLHEQDETRRLTLAFDQMLDALAASEKQRLAAERAAAWEEIARRLAHEIKNPLSPIQLAVENLKRTRERAPAEFDRAFAEETATILEEVASLRALVDEFAQFARLPGPRPAPCDPAAIAEQVLALYAARIEALGVLASVESREAPRSIRADAEQIGRVLKNAVANALDAMEQSRERRLAIVVRGEGGDVVFAIRDSGTGLDPETQRRIFEPYYTTRGDRGGTGLGMAIAHRIAVEHGGTLRAESPAGGGTLVTLTLPAGGPPGDRG